MPGSHNLVVRTPGTALFSPPEQTLGSKSAGGKSENERRELESVWSQGRMGSGICWNSSKAVPPKNPIPGVPLYKEEVAFVTEKKVNVYG